LQSGAPGSFAHWSSLQQTPLTQFGAQQILPFSAVWHCASVLQATQTWLGLQIGRFGSVQSALTQHSPVTQVLSQQMQDSRSGQSPSLLQLPVQVEGTHSPFTHWSPVGQSLLSQHSWQTRCSLTRQQLGVSPLQPLSLQHWSPTLQVPAQQTPVNPPEVQVVFAGLFVGSHAPFALHALFLQTPGSGQVAGLLLQHWVLAMQLPLQQISLLPQSLGPVQPH
jgi:hypothetical protein